MIPRMSIRLLRAPCDSGISSATATSASTTTGTLIRKTEPHQKLSSSQPPSSGPTGKAMNVAPMMTAMARARSSGANRTGSTAIDIGMITAAPRPRTARAAISSAGDPANAHAAELAPNATSAISSIFLRPSRSPSSPAGSRPAASTRL
jgi:hypothetical protein